MSGEIGAENCSEGGAHFWFILPLKVDKNARSEPFPTKSIQDVRVLIADDIEVNRKVLHEQITSWGMRNGQFASGEEVLKVLKEAKQQNDPYQIAILDLQMPGMDGEQVGEAIKADPEIADTVLVMLTSLGNRGDAKRLLDKGFAGYLIKPIHQSQLMDTLMMVWGAHLEETGKGLISRHTVAEQRKLRATVAHSKDKRIGAIVVEDNIPNQKVAKGILEKFGCRVSVVANGLECLDLFNQIPFDIIFMDIQMPEMNGYEATQAIRNLPYKAKASVPIIAMTAHALHGDKEKCLEAGMDDYIAKPVKSKDLREALEKWVKKAT